jgi:TatD DNase family protein
MPNNEEVQFFDTHCHLHEQVFDTDRDKIIEKMKKQNIVKFLTIGTSPEDTENALRLRDKYPDMCLVACAIDPTSTQKYVGDPEKAEADFKKIEKLARENSVSAIGETGLDKYWRIDEGSSEKFTLESLQIQHLLFELHIDLAKDMGLPLVIHQRDALTLTLKTLKEKGFTTNDKDKKLGVFHSFTGDVSDSERILNAGFYIGINGIVTFKNASKLQGAVKKLSENDFLYETDAPFLTPEPHRGQRNDPTFIPVIAEFIESLCIRETSLRVFKNSLELFDNTLAK